MALIPSGYLNAVLSLGAHGNSSSFKHKGTGFLYAHPLQKVGDCTSYRHFLVTNRHVAESPITHVRFNHPADGLKVEPLEAIAASGWTFHPKGSDIAVALLDPDSSDLAGRSLLNADIFIGDVGTTFGERIEPVEGDGVFLIGFPLGLVGEARNYPIVRQGVIARIQDWTQGHQNTFLIDAPAFPGNSGGPVILRPELVAIKGTQANTQSLLAGVVSQQILSKTENTGLAVVVPVEMVRDTANHAEGGERGPPSDGNRP